MEHHYSKVGDNSEALETVAFVGASVAFLEAGHLIYNVAGTGLGKINIANLTLHKILETVKKIEEKLDIVLDQPLKSANYYLQSMTIAITHQSYKDAYEIIKNQLIPNAVKALDFEEKNEIDINSFDRFIQAVKHIVFGNVLLHSYNEDNKQFLPFQLIPKNKKKIIGDELESLAKRSIALKDKVDASKSIRSKMKLISDDTSETAQNTLDGLLQATYPYISEIKGWTMMTKKLSPSGSKMIIKVNPRFLPFGGNDATEVKVGTLKTLTKASIVATKIWRNKSHVMCDKAKDMVKITDENEMMNIEIFFKDHHVIESKGLVAEKFGKFLGLYTYDSDHECFKQCGGKRYLFCIEDYGWFVGPDPTDPCGWLMNGRKSGIVPSSGWACVVNDEWEEDTTCVITKSTLRCHNMSVKDSFASTITNLYVRNGKFIEGKPIFHYKDNKIIFLDNDGKWSEMELEAQKSLHSSPPTIGDNFFDAMLVI